MADLQKQIYIALRLKPSEENVKCISYIDTTQVESNQDGSKYKFDKTFNEDDDNIIVFQQYILLFIQKCLDGQNVSIIAYGQTSSGKTFTLQGSKNCSGIVQMSLDYIFQKLRNKSQIIIQFFEIYNEKIIDLLEDETVQKDKYYSQFKKIKLDSIDHFISIYEICIKKRNIKSSKLNQISSRSHTILKISIFSELGQQFILQFVDLAGSEQLDPNLDRKETLNINKSLCSFNSVFTHMQEVSKNKQSYINFRDSSLTYHLEESFIKNFIIGFIFNINNSLSCKMNTQRTLQFSQSVGVTKIKEIRSQYQFQVQPNQSFIKFNALQEKYDEIVRSLSVAELQQNKTQMQTQTQLNQYAQNIDVLYEKYDELLRSLAQAEQEEAVSEQLTTQIQYFAVNMNALQEKYEELIRSLGVAEQEQARIKNETTAQLDQSALKIKTLEEQYLQLQLQSKRQQDQQAAEFKTLQQQYEELQKSQLKQERIIQDFEQKLKEQTNVRERVVHHQQEQSKKSRKTFCLTKRKVQHDSEDKENLIEDGQPQKDLIQFDFKNESHYQHLCHIEIKDFHKYFYNEQGRVQKKQIVLVSSLGNYVDIKEKIVQMFNFQLKGIIILQYSINLFFVIVKLLDRPYIMLPQFNNICQDLQLMNYLIKSSDIEYMINNMDTLYQVQSIEDEENSQFYGNHLEAYDIELDYDNISEENLLSTIKLIQLLQFQEDNIIIINKNRLCFNICFKKMTKIIFIDYFVKYHKPIITLVKSKQTFDNIRQYYLKTIKGDYYTLLQNQMIRIFIEAKKQVLVDIKQQSQLHLL